MSTHPPHGQDVLHIKIYKNVVHKDIIRQHVNVASLSLAEKTSDEEFRKKREHCLRKKKVNVRSLNVVVTWTRGRKWVVKSERWYAIQKQDEVIWRGWMALVLLTTL